MSRRAVLIIERVLLFRGGKGKSLFLLVEQFRPNNSNYHLIKHFSTNNHHRTNNIDNNQNIHNNNNYNNQKQQQKQQSKNKTFRGMTTSVNTPLAIFTATAFGLICYWFYNHRHRKSLNDLEIRLYNMLPLRVTSSLWGKINSYDLPIWMRTRLYDFFCRTYNCDMSEALDSDYRNYRNLSEFFSRRLKPDSRPISQEPGVVSPADGLILHFGPIENGRIEGVKGLDYSVQAFLGLENSQQDYKKELLVDSELNELYTCIIYLAPGDYHRFHSPANWSVEHRKHFPGRLLSVRPSLVKRMPKVLHINERVCYFGHWPHGFFSMTAVGATNVGSIKVNFDEDLRTNRRLLWWPDRYSCFEHKFKEKVTLLAGEDFGEFNFGSTIVLIFEAPRDAHLGDEMIGSNNKIKFGQLLAKINPPATDKSSQSSPTSKPPPPVEQTRD